MPTSTPTRTPTQTPTPTVTPPLVPVTLQIKIANTPVPGFPLLIDSTVYQSDPQGFVVTRLWTSHLYSISSGIEAVSFPVIAATGTDLNKRSTLHIPAERVVASFEAPCRVLVGNVPQVYFSTTNRSDRALSVPLSLPTLNSLYSFTGKARPPELFAPGNSGFAIPEAHFLNRNLTSGTWKFLGQSIQVPQTLLPCADRAVPGQCKVIDPAILRLPFDYTRDVVLKLTMLSVDAARKGKWKGTNGSFTVPFLARGSSAIAKMQQFVNPYDKSQKYQCQVVAASCTQRVIPKQALVRAFSDIFAGQLPKGLDVLVKNRNKEIATFRRQLKKLPSKYTECS